MPPGTPWTNVGSGVWDPPPPSAQAPAKPTSLSIRPLTHEVQAPLPLTAAAPEPASAQAYEPPNARESLELEHASADGARPMLRRAPADFDLARSIAGQALWRPPADAARPRKAGLSLDDVGGEEIVRGVAAWQEQQAASVPAPAPASPPSEADLPSRRKQRLVEQPEHARAKPAAVEQSGTQVAHSDDPASGSAKARARRGAAGARPRKAAQPGPGQASPAPDEPSPTPIASEKSNPISIWVLAGALIMLGSLLLILLAR
jgi:hypothetical protein